MKNISLYCFNDLKKKLKYLKHKVIFFCWVTWVNTQKWWPCGITILCNVLYWSSCCNVIKVWHKYSMLTRQVRFTEVLWWYIIYPLEITCNVFSKMKPSSCTSYLSWDTHGSRFVYSININNKWLYLISYCWSIYYNPHTV